MVSNSKPICAQKLIVTMIPNGMSIVRPITSSVGESSANPFNASLRRYQAYNRLPQLVGLGASAETSIVVSFTGAPVAR